MEFAAIGRYWLESPFSSGLRNMSSTELNASVQKLVNLRKMLFSLTGFWIFHIMNAVNTEDVL